MIDARNPGTCSRVETDFGTVYVHLDFRPDGKAAGLSISHQIKDRNSQIAELIDDLARGIHDALRAGL